MSFERLEIERSDVFKMLNCSENIDRNMFSSVIKGRKKTKKHELTLMKEQCRSDTRNVSFSQRTVNT